MVKYSIIVPVYNVQKYLSKCIESLVSCNRNDLQIILINDGSTDCSLEICSKYASKDSRIYLINQSNKGLSGARNAGLKVAEGEYVLFVDSDDWLSVNYCDVVDQIATKSDIDVIVFGHNIIDDSTNSSLQIRISDKEQLFENVGESVVVLDKKGTEFNYVWNKVYKRSVLDGILFNEEIQYCEDLEFNYHVFLKSRSVILSNFAIYNYRVTQQSLSNNHFYPNYRKLRILAIGIRNDLYKLKQLDKVNADLLRAKTASYLIGEVLNSYRRNSTFNRAERCHLINEISHELRFSHADKIFNDRMERFIAKLVMLPAPIAELGLSMLFELKRSMSSLYYKYRCLFTK